MYENGTSTRRVILDTCKKLFFENGFHETSYDDICEAAHVNRGSIYYHFREKERLRYEILWEIYIANRHLAEKYCPDARYCDLLAIYMDWHQCLSLPAARQFHLCYSQDYPIYNPNAGLSMFYRICYEHIFNDIWKMENITPLAFASVYGQLVGTIWLVCADPERYTGKEVFMHAIIACTQVWGIPEDEVGEMWKELERYIDQIPLAEIEAVI